MPQQLTPNLQEKNLTHHANKSLSTSHSVSLFRLLKTSTKPVRVRLPYKFIHTYHVCVHVGGICSLSPLNGPFTVYENENCPHTWCGVSAPMRDNRISRRARLLTLSSRAWNLPEIIIKLKEKCICSEFIATREAGTCTLLHLNATNQSRRCNNFHVTFIVN